MIQRRTRSHTISHFTFPTECYSKPLKNNSLKAGYRPILARSRKRFSLDTGPLDQNSFKNSFGDILDPSNSSGFAWPMVAWDHSGVRKLDPLTIGPGFASLSGRDPCTSNRVNREGRFNMPGIRKGKQSSIRRRRWCTEYSSTQNDSL